MHCKFFGGPMDGWDYNCAGALVGDCWLVRCELTITPAVFFGGAPYEEVTRPPVARYRLVDAHEMQYEGMQE